jgi:carbonic anhydrase
MSTDTWQELVEAHERSQSPVDGTPEHAPKAAILACSDARVPPSVIFDQPAGSLFVIRIAGNTTSAAALASLDYAVAKLGVDLIVVLGHTGCGAVTAAAAGTCGGHLAPIVEPICELAKHHPEALVDQLVELNVEHTVQAVHGHEGPAGVAARNGAVQLRGAVYDLATGDLSPTSQSTIPIPS